MVASMLPAGSRRRALVVAALVVGGLLLLTQFAMPGRGGAGRGTPGAVLFQGLVAGMVTAVLAAGLVLVYRALRVVNFSQAALGIAGATLTFEFVQFTPVPFPVALVLGLLLSTAIGFVFGLIMLRFARAPRLVLTVFTILLAAVLATQVRPGIQRLPFFPDLETRTIAEASGSEPIRSILPFPGWNFEVGSLPLTFGFAEVFAIELAILALIAVGVFLRFTRLGVAVRAMSENSERASLLGIGVGLLSAVVWALAGLLGGVGATLIGMLTTPGTASGFSPVLLVPALAAAVVGRLRSLPVAVFAAVIIRVFIEAGEWSYQEHEGLVDVGLLALIVVGFLLQRGGAGRAQLIEDVSSWQATEEHRPIPAELRGVASVRFARVLVPVLALAFVAVYPFVFSIRTVNLGAIIALVGIVGVSIVVLTGWAGQVSLGQYGFAAVGAVVGGALTAKAGIPFWFAVPIAAVVTSIVAVLVGIPALRLPGLLLLVATFAFAVAVQSVLFEERYFGWLLPDTIERPELFFLDFADERSMYFLSVGALALTVVLVTNLRRTRVGRLIVALRENEADVRAFGVSVLRTKLLAFAISGGLAGFAGAIFAHHQGSLNPATFGAENNIGIFVACVFGGVGSIAGVLIAVAYFWSVAFFNVFDSFLLQQLLTNGVTLYLLFAVPGGIAAILYRTRDAWLRVLAQRRRIVVPSLFADFDPDTLERQLIPLGETASSAGLAAVGGERRYTMSSDLYRGRGVRIADRLEARPGREAVAIGAAATHVSEIDETEPTEGRE